MLELFLAVGIHVEHVAMAHLESDALQRMANTSEDEEACRADAHDTCRVSEAREAGTHQIDAQYIYTLPRRYSVESHKAVGAVGTSFAGNIPPSIFALTRIRMEAHATATIGVQVQEARAVLATNRDSHSVTDLQAPSRESEIACAVQRGTGSWVPPPGAQQRRVVVGVPLRA
jgi:hypothetical protein